MATEINLHPIQGKILKILLFQKQARFRDLNPDKISTDQFSFHLKMLLDQGLLTKTEKGTYTLTAKGKEFANRFDTEKIALERQAKVAVLVVGITKEGSQTKYLTQLRLKQPYFGYRGFVSGKIRWGEDVLAAAERELSEETGLKASLAITERSANLF
jgi:hypothetical protein